MPNGFERPFAGCKKNRTSTIRCACRRHLANLKNSTADIPFGVLHPTTLAEQQPEQFLSIARHHGGSSKRKSVCRFPGSNTEPSQPSLISRRWNGKYDVDDNSPTGTVFSKATENIRTTRIRLDAHECWPIGFRRLCDGAKIGSHCGQRKVSRRTTPHLL